MMTFTTICSFHTHTKRHQLRKSVPITHHNSTICHWIVAGACKQPAREKNKRTTFQEYFPHNKVVESLVLFALCLCVLFQRFRNIAITHLSFFVMFSFTQQQQSTNETFTVHVNYANGFNSIRFHDDLSAWNDDGTWRRRMGERE